MDENLIMKSTNHNEQSTKDFVIISIMNTWHGYQGRQLKELRWCNNL